MKKLFGKGLVALLPMMVTIIVVYLVIGFLYTNVGVPLGDAMKWVLVRTGYSADRLDRESWAFRTAGLVLAVLLIFLAGALVATFFGKRLLRLFERVIRHTPGIGVIYTYARQFTDFFSPSGGKPQFKNAVAVPFPCYGVYSIGFITGEGMRHLNEAVKKSMATVFVPTAPTPFTGFVCWMPREDLILLPISVDDALRIIISCGVLTPPHEAVSLADFAAAAAREGKTLPPPPDAKPAP
jgi:uncharacterized membrane protein